MYDTTRDRPCEDGSRSLRGLCSDFDDEHWVVRGRKLRIGEEGIGSDPTTQWSSPVFKIWPLENGYRIQTKEFGCQGSSEVARGTYESPKCRVQQTGSKDIDYVAVGVDKWS